VRDVSFCLYEGEVLGLAGLVGAGRTEILQAVFGADPRSDGCIVIDGKELAMEPTHDAIRHNLGLVLVPEGRKIQGLFLKFSVQQNMTIVRLDSTLKSLGMIRRKEEEIAAEEYQQKLRVKTPSLSQRIVNL